MTESLFMYGYDDSIRGVPSYGYAMKYTDINSIWTSEDTKRAVLFSLVPGALSLWVAASFRKEKNLIEWWNASKKPNWAPKNPVPYRIINIATMAPIGWASYMAYKYGGGLAHNDTKLALSLYGGNMICAFLTVPLIKRKNYHFLFYNTLIMHLAGAGAALAFFKIDHKAGLLLVPYVLWTGFYSCLAYAMSKMNTTKAIER
uniref:TspO/MBR family protein n=1 Tax=Elaeophora elaphi TaxID=1147741 RepID=A0A0R3RKK9_9BILA